MRWIELISGLVVGAALFALGYRIYARPYKMFRYWYDTNRIDLAISKAAANILIFGGFLVPLEVALFATGRLTSWWGFLQIPVPLLGVVLFRPRRRLKRLGGRQISSRSQPRPRPSR